MKETNDRTLTRTQSRGTRHKVSAAPKISALSTQQQHKTLQEVTTVSPPTTLEVPCIKQHAQPIKRVGATIQSSKLKLAEIPVIDLRLADAAPEEAARMRDAARRLGCFRLTGHGVPCALGAGMKAAVRALFDLPDDCKRRNADVISGSGYVAPSTTNPLYEAFGLYDASSPMDIDAFCASLDAPPNIRETIRSYAEKMHGLIVDVAAKLAASLGLEEVDCSFEDWPCQFRINRYNYTADTVGKAGVQIHMDSGFLTVLHEDDCVGGLEVADQVTGEFVPLDHVPGTFLVNLGDVATAWSNGALHNVRHRVQCVAAVPRYSIALFMLAPKDDMVRAPEAFVSTERPRQFRTFGYEDYRRLRQSTGEHAGEALARQAA